MAGGGRASLLRKEKEAGRVAGVHSVVNPQSGQPSHYEAEALWGEGVSVLGGQGPGPRELGSQRVRW